MDYEMVKSSIQEHKETFETEVTGVGTGAHILVPRFLLGHKVRVTLEVID